MKYLEKGTGQRLAPPLRPPGGKASSGLLMGVGSLSPLPSHAAACPAFKHLLSLLAGASVCT